MAAVAAIAVAAFLGWLFSRQSTVGLFEWHPPWTRNFILIGISGLLPVLLALAGLRRRKDETWKPGAILAGLTIGFSALAIALVAGRYGSPRPARALR
jgi:hypothetical protein